VDNDNDSDTDHLCNGFNYSFSESAWEALIRQFQSTAVLLFIDDLEGELYAYEQCNRFLYCSHEKDAIADIDAFINSLPMPYPLTVVKGGPSKSKRSHPDADSGSCFTFSNLLYSCYETK